MNLTCVGMRREGFVKTNEVGSFAFFGFRSTAGLLSYINIHYIPSDQRTNKSQAAINLPCLGRGMIQWTDVMRLSLMLVPLMALVLNQDPQSRSMTVFQASSPLSSPHEP